MAQKHPTNDHVQDAHATQQPKGWYSRRYLPHCDAPGLIQHVTFHLADSLPRVTLQQITHQLKSLPDTQRKAMRHQRVEELLDRGLGSCVLKQAACAQIVQDAFLFGDGERYRLLAWVIMPNHVHVLIEQQPGWPLSKVVQSWKRHTSRRIHQQQTRRSRSRGPSATTSLWQRAYWDRFIRDEAHLVVVQRYIEHNPVTAGLVAHPQDWRWSSAYASV